MYFLTRAKSPSDAWTLLKHMVESDDSATARQNSEKDFKRLAIIVGEPARGYVARTKDLTAAVRYHRIVMIIKIFICRRILIGLPSHMHFVHEGFTLRVDYSLVELEHALLKMKEVKEQPDGSDGYDLNAGFKPKSNQGE